MTRVLSFCLYFSYFYKSVSAYEKLHCKLEFGLELAFSVKKAMHFFPLCELFIKSL